MKKFLATILFAAMTLMILASCGGSIPANTVFSADDLAGKKIGVQLGTVGDLFASDYEADGAVVERYNKGADAVQALKQGKVDAVMVTSRDGALHAKYAKPFIEAGIPAVTVSKISGDNSPSKLSNTSSNFSGLITLKTPGGDDTLTAPLL